ncbi:MAG TPA: xanthine dehydrogenase family protein molybdopterin-binding subunit [Candidatus Methylomirabilis sp.]|nr:xanthine dehydrogenase family protein molybdopterin-binding subunit [Candidatus Methylomirabilis sp.]
MLVGASLKRKEDARLVVGRGRFVDDIRLPGMLHLGLVRSPHAHARVTAVDGDAARQLDGVAAVWTLRDLPELVGATVPPLVPEPRGRVYVHPVLAGDRARHAGDAVAIVVAEGAYLLADALDRVVVHYEPLPSATTPARATLPSAPRVHDQWTDNLAAVSTGETGQVSQGFDEADLVVEGRFTYSRVGGMPIEPRGVVAAEDVTTGVLMIWCSTQVPFAVRTGVARALGVPEERVRVIVPEVGGGFGVKGHVYPEDVIVPAVARRLGRPVKWTETRREHFLSAAADRDQTHDARIGLRRDGTVVALETSFTRDHGAFTTLGEAIALNTINHLPGPYRIPNYRGAGRNVVTHKTFGAAYRGAGRPEAALVMDRLLDRAARRLRIDPAELRRRNLIRPEEMPYASGLTYRDGARIVYDPADYPAAFDAALRRLDYPTWRAEQARRRGTSRPIGIGLSAYVEGTGLGPFEGADVRVDPGGTVFVHVGVSAQGQAHETTLAQICADQLDVPIETVVVRGGDTQLVGYGMGTIASRVAAVAGPAVAQSAAEVARKAKVVAGEMFECAPEDVTLAGGRLFVKGVPDRSVTLARVAQAAVRSLALSNAGGPGLSHCGFFYPGTVTWAFGAQGVVLEVDLDTCAVRLLRHVALHDCGRPINPMVVEGQIHGGIVQGIGSGLMEELVHDEAGQLLTGTFMDYALPRADQVPPLDVGHLDYPSAINPLGIKGVGESGIIAPAAAIANAVEDALADYGVEVDRVPVTSARLFPMLGSLRKTGG